MRIFTAALDSSRRRLGRFFYDFHLARRALPYLATSRRLLGLVAIAYLVNALCSATPPWLVQILLDKAVITRNETLLLQLSVVYLAVIAFEYLSGFAAEYWMGMAGQRATSKIRQTLFNKILKLDSRYFDAHPQGHIITRMTADVESINEVFTSGAMTLIADFLSIMAVLVIMYLKQLTLCWVLVVLLIPLLITVVWLTARARMAFRQIRARLSGLNSYMTEYFGRMHIVQIFNQQARINADFARLHADFRKANTRAILLDASLFAFVEAMGVATVAFILFWYAPALGEGSISVGVLVAFIQASRRLYVPIRDFSSKYTILQAGLVSAERIFDFMAEPGALHTPDRPLPLRSFGGPLQLQNLWLSYKEAPQDEADYALRDICLRIEPGKKLGLVGPTGCGKSSLLRIIARFYDPNRGAITYQNRPLQDYQLEDVRSTFTLVQQEGYLFAGTILDNLRCGGQNTQAAISAAIAETGAEHHLARLPLGLQTPVRPGGSNLSAGQRQLLCLLQALALNPAVLLLDEATSQMDADTQDCIKRALDKLLLNRTALVVAHRLRTIEQLDEIVVLEQGRIVQQGSHHQLRKTPGLYRALIAAL